MRVKCQECLSRTIQWMSIPLAGVRHELSAYAGLLNKLGFRLRSEIIEQRLPKNLIEPGFASNGGMM